MTSAASLSERLIQAAVDYESGRCSSRELAEARAAVESAIHDVAQGAVNSDELLALAARFDGAIRFANQTDRTARESDFTFLAEECDVISAALRHAADARAALAAQPPAAPVEVSKASFCGFCDLEYELHEDAQGFHHVVKGERAPCAGAHSSADTANRPVTWRQSDEAIRNMIAREIWRYQECEEAYGPFDDNADEAKQLDIGMRSLIKQTAIDQAELIRAVVLASPVVKAAIARLITEDDVYEIGKRDGYEDAVQTIDVATGGDGEFRGSTDPDRVVDVPAMQARIIDRLRAEPQPARESDFERVFRDACDEVGCEYNNETLLSSIANLTISPRAFAAIGAERQRQISAEGWTLEHDDSHISGEMAMAAAVYALTSFLDTEHSRNTAFTRYWPWDRSWFKPAGGRRDLVRAAALIVAEIERLDRASSPLPRPHHQSDNSTQEK